MSQVPDSVLRWLYNSLKSEYYDVERTYSDVADTLSRFPSLAPRTEVHTFENGGSALLLVLQGTIPVQFRGAVYRYPLSIWIPHPYPREPPLVYVNPTREMAIRPGQHISIEGRVYHPFLADWAARPNNSTIISLLNLLANVFSKDPPVIARQRVPDQSQRLSSLGSGPPPPPRPGYESGDTAQGSFPPASRGLSLPPKSTTGQRLDGPSSRPDLSVPPLPPKPSNTPSLPGKGPLGLNQHQFSSSTFNSPGPSHLRPATDGPPLPPLPPHNAGQFQQYGPNPLLGERALPSRNYNLCSQPQMPPPTSSPYSSQRPHLPPMQLDSQPQSPTPHRVPPQQGFPQPQHQAQHPPQQYPQYQQHPQYQQPTPRQQQQQQPPKQPLPDLLSSPSDTTSPTTNPQLPLPAPPIPLNPEKDSLLSSISSALSTLLSQTLHQNTSALPALQAQQSTMHAFQASLSAELAALQQLGATLSTNEQILRDAMREAEAMEKGLQGREVPGVDEVLVAPTVVGEQLYQLVAEERGIVEAMFVLGRALERDRVSGEVFVKQTRSLAREQFLKKALIRKIAVGMGLSTEGRN